jgi:hypothetical protein
MSNGFASVQFGPASNNSPSAPSAPQQVATARASSGFSSVGNASLGIPAQAPPPMPADHPAMSNAVQIRQGGITFSTNANSLHTAAEAGTNKINMGALHNGEQGVLAAAKAHGTPKPASQLRPSDLVTFQGNQMTLEVAERIGLVSKDPTTGFYRDNGPTAEAAVAAPPVEPADPRLEDPHFGQPLPSEEAAASFKELVNTVTPGTQVRGILGVIDNGEVTQATLNSAATEAGIEPSAMQAKINSAMDGFRSQAASLAKSTGADPEAFFEWAKANRTGDMKEAMRNHVMQRTTAGYAPLLREFNESLAERDPDVVLNATFPDAGVRAFRGNDGAVVLSIPGKGTMSYRSAVKAGLIAPRWT